MLNLTQWTAILAYGGSHIYYNYCIICMLYCVLQRAVKPKTVWRDAICLFGINTVYFGVCSALGFGLLKNYSLFWLVFYLQERLLLRVPKNAARFFTLYVTLCTLSNILFYYGLAAVLMGEPLSYFENVFHPMDFRKIYALSVSYMSTTFALRYCTKEKNAAPLRHLISSMNQMGFMLVSMGVLFGYLLFQGIMYGSLHSGLLEKIWSLSGCIYISAGFRITLRYAIKLSYLYHLDEKNMQLQQALDRQKRDVSDLIDVADMDTLTKIRNHAAGMKEIQNWIAQKQPFVLCLIDLDGLKYTNDFIGHDAGDRYLLKVVEAIEQHCRQDRDLLWRHGGDEFMLAYAGVSVIEAYGRMECIAERVAQAGAEQGIPMQISFGVEGWDGSCDFDTLFAKVDEQMYRMKHKHKQHSPQLVRE